MQVVFLLAGANKRFYPFNTDTHKAMTSLYGKPILQYSVEQIIKNTGVNKFIFVLPTDETHIRMHFQNGEQFGAQIQYAQLDEPLGQGAALLKAAPMIEDSFIVVNPYHIDFEGVIPHIYASFQDGSVDGIIPGIYEKNIQDYGALILMGTQIKGIVEKPKPGEEPSHFRATSAYIFKKDFLKVLEKINPSHYSFEEAISIYAKDHLITMHEISSEQKLSTLKYPWHLFPLRNYIGEHLKGYISPHAHIARTAVIGDSVIIDEGATVMEGACITGNTYIGKNVLVGNYALVRDSDLERGVQVGAYSDIARSIIMEGTHFHGSGFIGDSIIGPHCRLAYGFVTANKRLDREIAYAYLESGKVAISERIGAMVGKEVHTGIRVSTMPGVIVAPQTIVSPGAMVTKNLI